MEKEDVILPVEGRKDNILVTSALPYVNNVPHLGNVVGSVLPADVFARYSKLRGRPTLYICGTDQYGTATETKALEAGKTCAELCAEFHEKHAATYSWFDVAFDYFGRTTTPKQTEIVQDIFLKLHKNGFLEERETVQPFCEKHGKFLADRFVEGTCPKCQYEDARGDQCDKCGGLLDPFELINPRCKLDGHTPVPRSTNHVYLMLNKLSSRIEEWFLKSSKEGNWDAQSIAITKAWIDKGLEGRSITRDMEWGVKVPLPGFENKVIYVWFDACIGYPSITANYTDEWEKWWKNPDDVKLYQFMGKDNVPFHTVIFPGSLLGTNEVWTKLNTLSTSDYLNYENTKFSKSRGVGIFGDGAKETGVSASVWRWYLMANRPENGDTQFEWATFAAVNNNELLANLGNFVNRTVKFVNAKLSGEIPKFSGSYTEESGFDFPGWIGEINALLAEYNAEMEATHLRAGTKKIMEISSKGNGLLQYRLDTNSLTQNPERTHTVIGLALNLSVLLASLCAPYMPTTAASIVRQLGEKTVRPIPNTFDPEILKPGHKLGAAEYLFKKIDEKDVLRWKEMFGGSQESRAKEAELKKKKQEEKEREKERKKASKAKKKAAAAAEAPTTAATEEIKTLPIREKEKPVEK